LSFIFLSRHSVNVQLGPREERLLITGLHTVADISCAGKERDKERELAIPPRRFVSLKKPLSTSLLKKNKKPFPRLRRRPRLEIRAGLRGVTAIQGREVYRREGKGGERRGVVKKGEG
jgi:hypothetical protein